MIDTSFKGAAKRLDDIDLPTIAKTIGVGEDEIHAILDVESAGSGFRKDGRPQMLFEPHVFYRMLHGSQKATAVAQRLAYEKWKPRAYPSDSYPRLLKAIAINQSVALQSASWALPQIMGFNYAAAGYSSVEAMIEDFMQDEELQLKAMIRFIASKKLDDELRRHDWRGFEKGYNGGGQNGAYANKLKARFEAWQKIKDTPITQTPQKPATAPSPIPAPSAPKTPTPTPHPQKTGLLAFIISLILALFKRK